MTLTRVGGDLLKKPLNIGAGVTIGTDGNATFSGIVTATAFVDSAGNPISGGSAGLGTALSDNQDESANKIYYTDTTLKITENTTINPPDSSNIAYTQYSEIAVEEGFDLIVEDGDDLVPDILGLSTGTAAPLAGAGGRVRADNFTNKAGTGAPSFPNGVVVTGVVTATSFSGDLTGNVTGSITGDISGNATGLSGSPNLVVGILTATDVVVTGDLTVQGTTTTLDTILTEVDKLEVGANNTTVGVAVTQSGSGYAMTVEGGNVGINTNTPQVTADIGGDLQVSGNIYGGHLGRKNWFDNGDFTSVQRYINTGFAGNHHPYGWIADRFQNRSAATVNWTRSTNVPTGKGFIYSAQVGSGTAGATCQTVELQAQGEEGVFAVGTFWCVSLWSTQPINRTSNNGFCQDLSATDYVPLTLRTPSSGSAYLSTGETAAGTSSGTFTRYYQIFEVTSGAHANNIGLSFGWGFNYSGSGTLEFTGFQLEQVANANCKPTAYEHVDIATQQRRCQRYAWRNDTSRILNGYKRHDGEAYFQLRCPVKPSPLIAPGYSHPMGITAWDYGIFTNHQSTLQNPAATAIGLFEFDSNSGYFTANLTTAYSATHVLIPSWESAQFEVTHGFF